MREQLTIKKQNMINELRELRKEYALNEKNVENQDNSKYEEMVL